LKSKGIALIYNFSYSITSNLTATLISVLVILVIPKLIGIEEYGYWQLYLFYTSYVGFLHFGWNDGIYLRYGGQEYKELNKKLFFSQFWMLFILQTVLGVAIVLFTYLFVQDENKLFLFVMTAICMLIINMRFMLVYILQGTNRIKEYSQIALSDRILYILFIVILIILGYRNYQLMIIADIVGKFLSLVLAAYYCRDIVFHKISSFYFSIGEALENIKAGIKLMFATISSNLIIGIIRFGIERVWGVSTFGKVSFTLSVSNLLMTFINAISLVLFPLLRRTPDERLPYIYNIMKVMLMIPTLGLLVLYYPFKIILSAWLPQYEESLVYMALVFPICIYSGKMSLLINTYLKTLRKERVILWVNVISVVLSALFTAIFTVAWKNLMFSIISIVILMAFRCILAEMILARILNISVLTDIVVELFMTIAFIITGSLSGAWLGSLIYLIIYIVYLIIMKKDIFSVYNNVKILLKS